MELEYFKKELVKIMPVTSKTARDFVIKHHYTHSLNLCKIAYGIFHKKSQEFCQEFFETDDYELIGAIVYSHPVGRNSANSISQMLKSENVLELVRMVIKDGYGKNIESFCLAESFRRLNTDHPEVKCILTYADSEEGHRGTIYQATGFLYQGDNYVDIALMPNYSVSLDGPPNYKWIHSRSVYSRWKTHNVDKLKERIGKTFWRKRESGKHRYVKFICGKIENKRLTKSLKHKALPYIKNTDFNETVFEHVVESKNDYF